MQEEGDPGPSSRRQETEQPSTPSTSRRSQPPTTPARSRTRTSDPSTPGTPASHLTNADILSAAAETARAGAIARLNPFTPANAEERALFQMTGVRERIHSKYERAEAKIDRIPTRNITTEEAQHSSICELTEIPKNMSNVNPFHSFQIWERSTPNETSK